MNIKYAYWLVLCCGCCYVNNVIACYMQGLVVAILLAVESMEGKKLDDVHSFEISQSGGQELMCLLEGNDKEEMKSISDDYDFYEEKYIPLFDRFKEIVTDTRYEKYVGNTTCLWALETLLSDNSKGETRITAKYHQDEEDNLSEGAYENTRRFEIDAYHIDALDLDVLLRVLKAASIEAEDPEEFEQTRFKLEFIKNPANIEFAECFHPHYSSYNQISGNRYDDNLDTNGSSLGIKAVRCYLLFNTDTEEFILADGRYWCV